MADLSITAANVVAGDSPEYEDGVAGASITAGQAVYKDTSDSNKFKLADANAASPAYTVAGISLHAAAANQPLKIQKGGNINLGATLTVGTIYVLSATAGGIAPSTDLTTGWRTTLLGVATSTSNLLMKLFNSGAAVP